MAVVYAKCLVNCTNHDETLAQAAIEQLQKLYDQYTSNTEIAIYYASGLSNRCFHHESQNVMGLVARLEELYQHHPVEPEISIRYARGLDALSRKQDVSEANSTAQRLKLLYTQNNNIIDIVQPVEKRPAWEKSRQAAKHRRYVQAENSRKERRDCRLAFHLASFLRFMAANLSLTHLETWARPL